MLLGFLCHTGPTGASLGTGTGSGSWFRFLPLAALPWRLCIASGNSAAFAEQSLVPLQQAMLCSSRSSFLQVAHLR